MGTAGGKYVVARAMLHANHLYDRWGRLAFEIQRFQQAAEADLVALLRDELWELVDLYQLAKQKAGQLDFNDLLFGARDLMQNDDARKYFQGRFKRIFVDEFQDTDPVQAEVLLLLAAGDGETRNWREAVPHPGKLFLVGDPKQSIYRFRRADVERYQSVKSLLTGAGVRQEQLQICRRSVQPILDFVNAAFQPLMGDGYLPLSDGRLAIEGQPSVIALPMPAPYGKMNFSTKAIEKCATPTGIPQPRRDSHFPTAPTIRSLLGKKTRKPPSASRRGVHGMTG